MAVEKVRFLAHKNIKGIPNVIYIKGDNIECIIKEYINICSLLNIEGRLLEFKNNEAYITYYREKVNSFILYGIIDGNNDIYEKAKRLLEDDWSYEIIKQLDNNNIPSININDDSIKIGYGKNSITLLRSESYNKKVYIKKVCAFFVLYKIPSLVVCF